MLKFDSNKLGMIKVFNVTEARSNFAGILSDKKSPYIITKNNRPLRVIINYDQFEKLLGFIEGQEVTKESSTDAEAPKSVDKNKKSGNRIPGLLESQKKLVQEKLEVHTESRELKTGTDVHVSAKKSPPIPVMPSLPQQKEGLLDTGDRQRESSPVQNVHEKIKKTEALPKIQQENREEKIAQQIPAEVPSWLKESSDDYFSSSSDIGYDLNEEGVLLSPDEIVQEESATVFPDHYLDRVVGEQKQKETNSKQVPQDNNTSFNLDAEMALEPKENIAKNESILDESNDYYKRYRKLYEDKPAQPVMPAVERKTDQSRSNLFRDEQPHQRVAATKTVPVQWDDPEYQPAPKKVSPPPVPQKNIKTEPLPAFKDNTDTPSLHDLLKELEAEKLIGEEEATADGQINDIIHRLRDNY